MAIARERPEGRRTASTGTALRSPALRRRRRPAWPGPPKSRRDEGGKDKPRFDRPPSGEGARPAWPGPPKSRRDEGGKDKPRFDRPPSGEGSRPAWRDRPRSEVRPAKRRLGPTSPPDRATAGIRRNPSGPKATVRRIVEGVTGDRAARTRIRAIASRCRATSSVRASRTSSGAIAPVRRRRARKRTRSDRAHRPAAAAG